MFELLRPDQPRSTRSGNEVLLLVLSLELVGERELGGLLLQLGELVLVLGHLEWGIKQALDIQDMKWSSTSEVRPPRRIRLMDVGGNFIRQFEKTIS